MAFRFGDQMVNRQHVFQDVLRKLQVILYDMLNALDAVVAVGMPAMAVGMLMIMGMFMAVIMLFLIMVVMMFMLMVMLVAVLMIFLIMVVMVMSMLVVMIFLIMMFMNVFMDLIMLMDMLFRLMIMMMVVMVIMLFILIIVVVMMMPVLMFFPIFPIMMMLVHGLGFFFPVYQDAHMGAGDAAFYGLLRHIFNAGNTQFVQLFHKSFRIGEQFQKGCGKHIARGAHA